MKKSMFLFIVLAFLVNNLFSQEQLQNGGFENWESIFLHESPAVWTSGVSNPAYLGYGVIKYEDAYSGDYAVKLQSYYNEENDDTAFSYVFLGRTGEDGPESGIPYTSDFDQISGYYKYNMQEDDSATILLIKFLESDPTFFLKKIGGVLEEWTKFTFDVPPGECDSVFFGFISSDPWTDGNTNFDSWFIVDSVHFINTEGETPEPLPNYDFEVWEEYYYNEPEHWHSLNYFFSVFGEETVSQTEDAYEGMYAVKISTMSFNETDTIPGFLSYGEIILGNDFPFIPIPYTDKPTKLMGYYKYYPHMADTGMMMVQFLFEGDIIESKTYSFEEATEYEYFEVDFTYYGDPDSFILIFSSGSNPGSTLYLDAISFDFETIINESVSDNDFTIYPNPATDYFYCNFSNHGNIAEYIEIVDLQGRIIKKIDNNSGKNLKIDISDLSNGIYYIRTELNNSPINKLIVIE